MHSREPQYEKHDYRLTLYAALGLLLMTAGTIIMFLVMIPVELVGKTWDWVRGRSPFITGPEGLDDLE